MSSVLTMKRVLILMLVGTVVSQMGSSYITASTCASSNGYTTCYESVTSQATKCYAEAGSDQTRQLVCGCEGAAAGLSCALANCWNVVYGCEYQSVANLLVSACFAQNVPFFPAPENAPGACSCNLGQVIYNMTAVATHIQTCAQEASGNVQQLTGCGCCAAAGEYTAKFSICPDLDPRLDGSEGDLTILQTSFPQFGQCGPVFNQYDCIQDLGFPAIGSIPYLSALPASTGTATYSTLPGTISRPLSGASFVFTASLLRTVSTQTIIAAGATGTATRTAGSSSASTDAASTNAAVLVNRNDVVMGVCLVVIWFHWLLI